MTKSFGIPPPTEAGTVRLWRMVAEGMPQARAGGAKETWSVVFWPRDRISSQGPPPERRDYRMRLAGVNADCFLGRKVRLPQVHAWSPREALGPEEGTG